MFVTANYTPYEQLAASSPLGPWSDIYMLGATLYRCITGQSSVEALVRVGDLMRGAGDPQTPAAEAAKGDYSGPLLSAIDRALSPMEKDRPQSVGEFRWIIDGDAQSGGEMPISVPIPIKRRGWLASLFKR